MPAKQRSKTGCWTCRLRKKKCIEDGPPCTNCRQFGVLCHGYGPRPTWKDRGDLEKEEARRIRLRAKRPRTISISSGGSVESATVASFSKEHTEVPCPASQTDLALPYSPPQPGTDADLGTFPASPLEHMTDLSFSFDDGIWVNELGYNLAPYCPVLPQPSNHQFGTSSTELQSQPKQSHFGIKASDSDIFLIVDFLESTFCRQYLVYSLPSAPQKPWLLCLMLRSPTFFNTSLSMSAYLSHLDESADSSAREQAFNKYQRYRDLAMRNFHAMYLNPPAVHGEPIICGVHLAALEALGNKVENCQSYLGGVLRCLGDDESFLELALTTLRLGQSNVNAFGAISQVCHYNETAALSAGRDAPSPLPSSMEHTAALFFTATFVWNDILCAAAGTRTSRLGAKYYNLLAEPAFSSVLREITGCDAWVLRNIMDITALEISKVDQLSDGILSVRDLVHRASEIEAAIEYEIGKLPSHMSGVSEYLNESDPHQPHSDQAIRARIFGHAALVYLNTVVSGALTGVPEIHQSICQILPSWEKLSAATNFKYLAWAYSTTASLATGAQRPVFQDVMTNASLLDSGSGIIRCFKSGVEECWNEIDRHAPSTSNVPCDWREMHKKANLQFIFL